MDIGLSWDIGLSQDIGLSPDIGLSQDIGLSRKRLGQLSKTNFGGAALTERKIMILWALKAEFSLYIQGLLYLYLS